MDRQDILSELVEAAQLAPTSFNLQHFRFIDIRDADKQQTLLNVATNWDHASAPEFMIAFCGNNQCWKDAAKYAKHVSPEFEAVSQTKATMVYEQNPQTQSDEANRSCGFALTNMILTAYELGRGFCILNVANHDAIAQLLNVPEDHTISAVVAFDKSLLTSTMNHHSHANVIFENRF